MIRTDEDLGDLLTETFTAHEHLADPERAVEIAATTSATSSRRRQLLAVAASVALVAVCTTYAVSQGLGSGEPSTPAAGGHQPPLPPLQTDAGNRARAEAAAGRTAAALPAYPGAQETNQVGVPELSDRTLSTVHPTDHTIVRSRFWTVTGVDSKTVARWYAAHPLEGFGTEGGANGVGGESGKGGWIDEVYWDDGISDNVMLAGTSVEIETTNTSAGVGIRLTVSSVWPPARPPASYVQDVSSIDVRSVHRQLRPGSKTTHRSFTVSDPREILRAAIAFNALPGMTPVALPCPMPPDVYTDRVVFHTATGDVIASGSNEPCGYGMVVRRDGHRIDPQLRDADQFLRVLGLDH